MNAVTMELQTLTLYCGMIIIFIPCVEFKQALDELNKIELELGHVKRKVKYGRLLLEKIDVTQFKGKSRKCKCVCGGEGDGNKFKPNKYVVQSEEVPHGRPLGVTRGSTKAQKRKQTKKGATMKPSKRPRSNFLSTAYKKLLENLSNKVTNEQSEYLAITNGYSEYYNSTMKAGRLDILGFPMVLVQQIFAAELSNRANTDAVSLQDPTISRLGTFNHRDQKWNGEDRALLDEADTMLERYPREGDNLLMLVDEIKEFPAAGSVKSGHMLMKDIFDAFIKPWELMDIAEVEFFMDRVNKALQVHGYGDRRYLNVIDTMGRQNNDENDTSSAWNELDTAMNHLSEMANKIKYSKLLLKDINIMNLESVEGCMCKKCPGAKGDYMYNAEMEFPTELPFGSLPNYYANVNHGFLPVAFEMYMDAIADLDPVKVQEVVTHSLEILNSKLLKGDLGWLGQPMEQVIISTAKVLTKMPIDMLQMRAGQAADKVHNRYTYYSEYTNNILDYADTLIEYNKGRYLINVMEQFENIPLGDITPKELCAKIIEAYEQLYSGLDGTHKLNKLMWHANTALMQRFPRLTKIKPGGRG